MLKQIIIIVLIFICVIAIRSYFTHKNYKSSIATEKELREMEKQSKATTILSPNDISTKHQITKETQTKIKNLVIWEDLVLVKYETNGSFYKPLFDSQQIKWEDKKVIIEGYLIPIDAGVSSTSFLFSLYPYQSCFFCGGAGIETMIEVEAEKPITYTDKAIKLKGILLLNKNPEVTFLYGLKKASIE